MIFNGHVDIQAPHRAVWEFFQAVEQLALCIPGCQSVEPIGDGHYKALMVESIGMFRVSFAMDVTMEEVREGESITASVKGTDSRLASSFRQSLKATFTVSGADATRVDLTTDVQFLGKIASLGHSMIKRKADDAMRKFGDCVKARLENA